MSSNFVSSSKQRIERAKQDWSEGRFALVPAASKSGASCRMVPERNEAGDAANGHAGAARRVVSRLDPCCTGHLSCLAWPAALILSTER